LSAWASRISGEVAIGVTLPPGEIVGGVAPAADQAATRKLTVRGPERLPSASTATSESR
jgi:hypothetical protein